MKRTLVFALLLLGSVSESPGLAAPINIANAPLFLTDAAPPLDHASCKSRSQIIF